mgnify:FL=1
MERRSVLAFILILLLVPNLVLAAPARTIPVGPETNGLELVGADGSGLNFRATVGELRALEVATKGGDFARLVLPGFHSSKDLGAPELPMMNELIAVPFGATARVEIANLVTRSVKLADYGVDIRVMPAQPSMPKNVGAADWAFVYETAAYDVVKVARETAVVVPQGRLRGVDFARLEYSPIRYLPGTGELEIVESADLRVVFEGGDRVAGDDLYEGTWSPFYTHLYDQLTGSRGLHDSFPDHVQDVVTMVIITPPEFQYTLTDFVNWKTQRGFNVIVGVTGTPEVGATTTSIQSFIQNLYDNPTPASPAPSFVIFVGDTGQMPTWTVGGDATDRPYCTMDGDYVPDIYYGRLSCTNVSQLQAILEKTLVYDQFTMPDPSYLGEVTMIAGVDASFAPTHGNGQINYGTNTYFNAAHDLVSNTWLYPASNGAVESAVIQTVSDGVAYINYTAHGSQTSWADPTFTQSNINSLTNAGKYTLAVGNCCLTATFNYAECFGETFLRAPNKGAIGYIGASNNTLWDEDFWWGVGSCASGSINANPTYAGTGTGAYDGVFHDHGEAADLYYVTNDALVFAGNLAVQEAGSGSTSYYWNIYNLLGDPSLSTYMGVPAANPVSIGALGATSLTVSASPGSYVGLSQGTTLIGAGTVGATGTADIVFLATPDGGQPLHVVVTAQNREPFVDDVALASPVLALSGTAFAATQAPDVITADVLTISNTGEPDSQLQFSLGIQAETPPARGLKSVTGSSVTCTESGFFAGTTVDLHLSCTNGSSDDEWLTDIEVTFPSGVTVNSATAFSGGSAPLNWDSTTGDGVTVNWHGNDGSWGALHGGQTATATVNVTFDGSLSGVQTFGWFVQGDIYGSAPHDLTGSFTMAASGPSVTVTSPNGGEALGWGTSHSLTWDHAGDLTDVKVELSRDGGTTWATLAATTPNDGELTAVLDGPSTTTARIRVASLDDAVSDVSDADFTLFEPVTWLSADVTSGVLAQGASQDVTLTCVSAGMADGTYVAYVMVHHNAAPDPEVVTVTMTVQTITGADDAPRLLTLAGNYPNPFNPSTTVIFALPAAGEVNLDVVDVRGHIVRTLQHGTLPAGDHRVVWDGVDDRGQVAASGVYFVRLRHQGGEISHKMLLAK